MTAAPSSRVFLVPLIIACALFMENMDATVISTSLPVLARDLGVSPIALKLALTAYVVGLGVFIPICGWVADRLGSRSVFRAAIVVFMAGSLLCAVCTSLPELVIARFIQGLGGAMMVPVGRIIIFRAVPRTEFVRAISYLTVPALFGPVIGPPLGGFITTYFHWRWIFFINVPIGLLGIALATRFIENRHEEDPGPLDLGGLALSAVGGSCVMLGLSLVGGELVSEWVAFGLLAAGVLALYLYRRYVIVVRRRGAVPLLDLSLLRIPTFQASVLGGSLFRIGLGALPFLLPLSLQEGLGMSAFESGTITCATAFGGLFMKGLAAPLLERHGYRTVLIFNALFSGIAIAACGLFTPHTPHWALVAVVLLGGFFPALQFTCLNSIAYAEIPSRDVSRATSLASVVQQLSLGMGVTIAGLTLQLSHEVQGHAAIVNTDFWPAFLTIGLFSVASIPLTRRLAPDAGDELARRSRA
ncbi:MAG: MFS transporter [Pelomonas sp.]|nr:MFS transporter [Roseateles sp.]